MQLATAWVSLLDTPTGLRHRHYVITVGAAIAQDIRGLEAVQSWGVRVSSQPLVRKLSPDVGCISFRNGFSCAVNCWNTDSNVPSGSISGERRYWRKAGQSH